MKYPRSIVIGSGMGGLVTARVLSDYFDEVVLIDRDAIPDTPEIRHGTPQANHFHGILPGGLEIMCSLFPGFDDELDSHGAISPGPAGFYAYGPEGKSYNLMRFQPEPSKPQPTFPSTRIQTRILLEHCLRRRVEQVSNITTRYSTMVRDVMTEGNRVTGVVIDGI